MSHFPRPTLQESKKKQLLNIAAKILSAHQEVEKCYVSLHPPLECVVIVALHTNTKKLEKEGDRLLQVCVNGGIDIFPPRFEDQLAAMPGYYELHGFVQIYPLDPHNQSF